MEPAYKIFYRRLKSMFGDKQCGSLYHNGNVEMCCVKKRHHFGKHKDYFGNWDYQEKQWVKL